MIAATSVSGELARLDRHDALRRGVGSSSASNWLSQQRGRHIFVMARGDAAPISASEPFR